MRTLLAPIVAVVMSFGLVSNANAGSKDPVKVSAVQLWNGWSEAVIVMDSPAPDGISRIWFDATTSAGRNLLTTVTAAQLAGKPCYVSWEDAVTQALGGSAHKLSAFSIHN